MGYPYFRKPQPGKYRVLTQENSEFMCLLLFGSSLIYLGKLLNLLDPLAACLVSKLGAK